jgi:hypothetical protein
VDSAGHCLKTTTPLLLTVWSSTHVGKCLLDKFYSMLRRKNCIPFKILLLGITYFAGFYLNRKTPCVAVFRRKVNRVGGFLTYIFNKNVLSPWAPKFSLNYPYLSKEIRNDCFCIRFSSTLYCSIFPPFQDKNFGKKCLQSESSRNFIIISIYVNFSSSFWCF